VTASELNSSIKYHSKKQQLPYDFLQMLVKLISGVTAQYKTIYGTQNRH